mgnify:FL=1
MKFDLHLKANFWRNSPSLVIKLNDRTVERVNDFVNEQMRHISFDADLDEGDHQLIIERVNKSTRDTVVEDSKIVKDSTIEIIDVIIDDISIDGIMDNANFFPKYPEPWLGQQKRMGKEPSASYNYCRTLHHNGEWKLDFANPIHIWFFQNINVQI